MTEATEVSGGGFGLHGRLKTTKDFDLTHALLTLLICLCFGAVWWSVYTHEAGDERRAAEAAKRDLQIIALIAQLSETNALLHSKFLANQERIIVEVGFGNKAVQVAVEAARDEAAYIASLTDAQRVALRLSEPRSLRDRRKVKRADE